MLKLTFISHFLPIQLPCCYLDPSFLLFLPSMESLCKSFVVPRNVTYRLSYLSVLSHTHKPCLGNFQFECALWVSKIPTTSILQLLCQPCLHHTLIFQCAGQVIVRGDQYQAYQATVMKASGCGNDRLDRSDGMKAGRKPSGKKHWALRFLGLLQMINSFCCRSCKICFQ